MREKTFILLAAILLLMSSCQSGAGDGHTGSGNSDDTLRYCDPAGTTDSFSRFIPKDSANKMITSYLNSIGDSTSGTVTNDSDLRSLIIDVKALSDYCKQSSAAGYKPVKMKLMFAHTLDYINSGRGNQNCGYQSGKLTLVVALYDSMGNYIYMNGNCVLDDLQPCPTVCPTTGSAAQNTFPN